MRLSAVAGILFGIVFAGRSDGGLLPAAIGALALFVPLAFARAAMACRGVMAHVRRPAVAP